MSVIAIIQARMKSTRLPGKVLLDLHGETVLERVVSRVQRMRRLDGFVVATSRAAADDRIEELCRRRSWQVFRGEELDVLDRYYQAARVANAQHVVRVTADCPLVSVEETDRLITRHLESGADYSHNITVWGSGMPLGTGSEIFTLDALERSWRDGKAPHHREHVDEYVGDHPELFKVERLLAPQELYWPDLRLTVDEAPDLELMRAIYARLERAGSFINLRDVIQLIRREPDLFHMNQHVRQKVI